MIKIGILSFSENNHLSVVEMIEGHELCEVVGAAHFNHIVMKDDMYIEISDIDDLIHESDLLVLDAAGSDQFELMCQIIRNSKHIYLINEKKLSIEETQNLIKLSEEAYINFVISQPYRANPLFDIVNHNSFISFINITENGIHNENDLLLYNSLIEKVDMLLMIVKSNIYRISACSSSDEFINIRMEFDNAINANITVNQLADSNESWIEIISPGENIKIDLIKNEIYKINKTKKIQIYNNSNFNEDLQGKSVLHNEFSNIIQSIMQGRINLYNIGNYQFANIITDEILQKISYVLT